MEEVGKHRFQGGGIADFLILIGIIRFRSIHFGVLFSEIIIEEGNMPDDT